MVESAPIGIRKSQAEVSSTEIYAEQAEKPQIGQRLHPSPNTSGPAQCGQRGPIAGRARRTRRSPEEAEVATAVGVGEWAGVIAFTSEGGRAKQRRTSVLWVKLGQN